MTLFSGVPMLISAVLQMVAGRFINCYATNDWTLAIAFRARYVC